MTTRINPTGKHSWFRPYANAGYSIVTSKNHLKVLDGDGRVVTTFSCSPKVSENLAARDSMRRIARRQGVDVQPVDKKLRRRERRKKAAREAAKT